MNRQPTTTTRPLTTSARVHPPYLPYLHSAASRSTKGKKLKWLPPLAAVVTAGYAVTSYRDAQAQSQLAASSSPSAEQAEAAERRRQQREAAMADAYGDRDSLEALERAVAVYEAQRGGR
ncbi:hypothetical protein C8A01DRAFT_31734 [Parachaetomium inaequale]|uniref:Uncharacterized protein n=1 Tax=Parachaetomium inaequale TaxID=2588326 RepID=A0AAN6PNM2_9PEZI|nr:hypothetical protein C8A01DRAFT_31734 [Parachaetomium inaequale]